MTIFWGGGRDFSKCLIQIKLSHHMVVNRILTLEGKVGILARAAEQMFLFFSR